MSDSAEDAQLVSEIDIKQEEIDIKQEEIDESLLVESLEDPELPQTDANEEIFGFSIKEIDEDPETDFSNSSHEEFVPFPAPKKLFVFQLQNSNTVDYKCEICAKTFTNLEILTTHKSIHEEMVNCHICSDKIMKKAFKFHMEMEHREVSAMSLPIEPERVRKRKISEDNSKEVISGVKSRRRVIITPNYCEDAASGSESADENSVESQNRVMEEPQIKEEALNFEEHQEPLKITPAPQKVVHRFIAPEEVNYKRKYHVHDPTKNVQQIASKQTIVLWPTQKELR